LDISSRAEIISLYRIMGVRQYSVAWG